MDGKKIETPYLKGVQLGTIPDNTEGHFLYTSWNLQNIDLENAGISHAEWTKSKFLTCSFKSVRIAQSKFNAVAFTEYSSDREEAIEGHDHDYKDLNKCSFENAVITNTEFKEVKFILNTDNEKTELENLLSEDQKTNSERKVVSKSEPSEKQT